MTGAKFAQLLKLQERAETRMTRAFNKWAKLRAQVKRAAVKLDKAALQGEGAANELGSEYALADMAKAAGIKPRVWPARKHK